MRGLIIATSGVLATLACAGSARAGSDHSHASQSLEDAARYEAAEGRHPTCRRY